jgi:predicted naringenin-chalcone synthase
LNGLRIAAIIAAARASARVQVCAAELCSLHYQYGQKPDKLVADAIFADGASAVVCGGPRGFGRRSVARLATRAIGLAAILGLGSCHDLACREPRL